MKKIGFLMTMLALAGFGCQQPNLIDVAFVEPDTLYRQIAVYENTEITVRGTVKVLPTECTEMACIPDESCTEDIPCNSCGGALFLTDDKESALIFLEGESCSLKEYVSCEDGSSSYRPLECAEDIQPGGFYDITGVIQESDGAPLRLMDIKDIVQVETF